MRNQYRTIGWGEAFLAAFFFTALFAIFVFVLGLFVVATHGWLLAGLIPVTILALLFKYTKLGQKAL
jgi:hypothetical protein